MTFHGEAEADEKVMAHVHESPTVMLIPLYVLRQARVFRDCCSLGMMVGDHSRAILGRLDPDPRKSITLA